MSIFSTNVVTPSAHWAKKGTRNKPAINLLCYLCVCDSIFLTDIRKYMPPDVAFSKADYQLGACMVTWPASMIRLLITVRKRRRLTSLF